jgi:hypothetical protein
MSLPDAVNVGVVAIAADERLCAIDESAEEEQLSLLAPDRFQEILALALEFGLQIHNL